MPKTAVDRGILPADEPPLTILYRDDDLVVIDKPPGLLVHRSDIDRRETRFAIQILRNQIGQKVWPAHRLDRGTSGVLVFALHPAALAATALQFEHGSVGKRYLAVVRGHPAAAGEIDHALSRQLDAREYAGDFAGLAAQPALTRFRRLAMTELPEMVDRYPSSRYALLELEPVTGRRHQLRRHLKHIAHPIIGDATYGKGRHNRFFAEKLDCRRLLLACTELNLNHPKDGRPLSFRAPVSGEFAALLRRFGWGAAVQ